MKVYVLKAQVVFGIRIAMMIRILGGTVGQHATRSGIVTRINRRRNFQLQIKNNFLKVKIIVRY